MSKGRAVPPPVDPLLPHPRKMERIADVVHRAIVAESGTDGVGLCTVYAWVGALVANITLLDAEAMSQSHYDINVGSCTWPCTRDGLLSFMKADDPDTRGIEFHAVMMRGHADGRYEVADLSSRHYQAWAERGGIHWDLPAPPLYVWGWADDITARGIVFQADIDLTQRVRQTYAHVAPDKQFVEQVTRHALRLLGKQERRRA